MYHYKKECPYMSPAAWIPTVGGIFLFIGTFFRILKNLNQSDVFRLNPFIGKVSAVSLTAAVILFMVWLALYVMGGDRKRIERCVKKEAVRPEVWEPAELPGR